MLTLNYNILSLGVSILIKGNVEDSTYSQRDEINTKSLKQDTTNMSTTN